MNVLKAAGGHVKLAVVMHKKSVSAEQGQSCWKTPAANYARPPMNPDSLKELIKAAVAFRDERDWAQFHNPKELAISLSIESAELLQLMQWHKGEELEKVIAEKHGHLKDELADVLFSVLLLANELKIDLGPAFLKSSRRPRRNIRWRRRRGVRRSIRSFNAMAS